MSERIPDWYLEQLAKGELPADQATALRTRLAADPDGEARLMALTADDAATLAAHPPADVAAEVARRLEVDKRRRAAGTRDRARQRWAWAGALGVAAAVVALLVVRPSPPFKYGDDPGEVTRVKGGTRLVVHRRRGNEVELLANGARARRGDVLQLAYAAERGYGVVVSVDGRGSVTVHLPESGERAAPLSPEGRAALPHAYELDDAPELERFFLVTGTSPFPIAAVVEAARALAERADRGVAQLPLPAALRLEQTSFLIEKVTP